VTLRFLIIDVGMLIATTHSMDEKDSGGGLPNGANYLKMLTDF
jgi:hypothetical protein